MSVSVEGTEYAAGRHNRRHHVSSEPTGHGAVAFGRKVCEPPLEEVEKGWKMALGETFFRGVSPYETTAYAPPPRVIPSLPSI